MAAWTTGGHYVAFVDWKYKNGDYWFYCKDSGGRKHDGWYSYKQHMAGVAQYASSCTYKGAKVMWQYTSSGSVNGISGKVDLSYVY